MRPFSLLLVFLVARAAWPITTAYVSFDQPEGWKCELSEGTWICQAPVDPDRRESVVLSIAATATEWDSIQNYENYLKQTKKIQTEDGRILTSKITFTRQRKINGFTWVDSLQFNSELEGFWSRYVATVHQVSGSRLAILITYVVSESRYSKLAPALERMISSLRPTAQLDITVPSKQQGSKVPGNQILGQMPDNIPDLLKDRLKAQAPKTASDGGSSFWMLLLLAVIVVGGFLYIKRRGSQRKS